MKITRLETFVIGDGPEIDPDKGGVEPLACVRIHTDEGLTGLSEVFRVPPGVVQATVGGRETHFGRLLIGQEISHPERIWQHLWDAFMHTNRRGWEIIILGAIDVAVWDLYGQRLQEPVWRLLGGVQRGPFQTPSASLPVSITPYCTIVSDVWGGEAMFAQQVARIERLAALGYRAFKVEPMISSPCDVVELARRARQALGSGPKLMVDVGYLFNDVPTAVRVCRELEELDIFFFETPFPVDTPEPYERLAAQTSIPLAMGEHGVTRWEFLDMMDRGGVSVVQPYMTTCGGLTEAKRIVELARARGALVCPGNWSTQILGAATVHLAAYSPITPFIEFAPAEVFDSPLRRELQAAGFPVANGTISLPERSGIGYVLPEEFVEGFQLGKTRISSTIAEREQLVMAGITQAEGTAMTKIVHDVEPPAPPQTKTPIGGCPRCSHPVEGFQVDAHSREDVLITAKPCGCTSHSTDAWYPQFIDLVKASGSLSGTNGSVVAQ